MNQSLVFSLFLLFSLLGSESYASWHERKAEGWAWYEDKKEKLREEEEEQISKVLSASDSVKVWEKHLEELRSKAILEPTSENVGAYIAEQHQLLQNGHKFSSEWMKFVLNNPEYDQTIEAPVESYAVDVQKDLEVRKRKEFFQKLSTEYGLFFFFDSTCSYSQAFSEMVKEFSLLYAWDTVAVSMDGGPCQYFPDAKIDNGISEKFSVTYVPSLFAVNPKTNEVFPLAFGIISREKIEDNVMMQFRNLYEGEYNET
jgi:conjugal transfer pilus assembly protein TraF